MSFKNNELFYAFRQGIVQSGAEKAGNCASVALIKAAIDAFGVGKVFNATPTENGLDIELLDGTKFKLSKTEFEIAKTASAFELGEDCDDEKEAIVFKEILEYSHLCFAVIVKHVQLFGERFGVDDILKYTSFDEALENVNDGLYAPLIYHYLGLSNHLKEFKYWHSTSGEGGFVAWSNGHVVYACDGFYDDHGVRRKMNLRFYGRFQIIC